MKQYYQYDSEGYFTAPIVSGGVPENATDKPPPQPCYHPRFDTKKKTWIEERPDPQNGKGWNPETKEWDLEPVDPEPDLSARIAELEAALLAAMEGLT